MSVMVVVHAGVAVVAVMCITTAMASICMLLVWRLHPILPLSFWLVLTLIEGTYLTSVLYKVHLLLFPLLLRTPKSPQFCTRYTCCCSHPYRGHLSHLSSEQDTLAAVSTLLRAPTSPRLYTRYSFIAGLYQGHLLLFPPSRVCFCMLIWRDIW